MKKIGIRGKHKNLPLEEKSHHKPVQKVEFLPNGDVKISYSPKLSIKKDFDFYDERQKEFEEGEREFEEQKQTFSKGFPKEIREGILKLIRK